MSELNEVILAAVTGSGLGDYDQRSALGMARGWLDSGKPIRWNPDQVEYPKRGQLAKDLVALMEGYGREECIEALMVAREAVNAPFQDPSMLGFRARRLTRGIVGSPKKNEKMKVR